ncbi:MAG: dienelactone hydrolase family protein [Roseimicrobium sp.]
MKYVAIPLLALLIATISLPVHAQSPKLTEGFKRADSNGDGKLSADEVNQFPQLKTKLQGADKDGDGFITFEEFRTQLIAGARPPSTPSSPETRLTAGEYTRTISVGDLQRRYRVHVPKKYDAANPTPVVIVFHGGGGNPESMVRLSGMDTKSDEAGFIVVYPYGSGLDAERGLTFNGGGCCGYAMQRKIDDVGFTRALLDDLAKVANVDTNRVFATGLSNGGIMSHYVASELSDRIAAIAPVGGPLMMDAPNAKRPVSIMHFHGTGDEFAPFKGGFGKGGAGGKGVTDFKSVEHTIQSWVKANGCKPEPEVVALPDKADDGMKGTRKTWSGGKDGSEVVLIEIENGGHTWPGLKPTVAILGPSTMDISANDLMWEFFQEHPMKPVTSTKAEPKP